MLLLDSAFECYDLYMHVFSVYRRLFFFSALYLIFFRFSCTLAINLMIICRLCRKNVVDNSVKIEIIAKTLIICRDYHHSS